MKSEENIPLFIKKLLKWKQARLFICSSEEASFIKYTLNVLNAFKISYINEFGDLMKQDGLDPNKVIDFIFQKKAYMRYGKSFVGNCLPKDIKAFASEYGSSLCNQIIKTNEIHKIRENDLKRVFSRDE